MKWRSEVNVDLPAERVSYYYTTDYLGSVGEMTDGSGTIQARYDYDPYGRVTKVSGSLDSDFQYAGMYIHQPSGLNLTRGGRGKSTGRPYDPNTARFPSRDPMGEAGGVNLYAYVLNDPINSIDPWGLDVWIYDAGGSHAYIVVSNPGSPTGYTSASYAGVNAGYPTGSFTSWREHW